MNYLGYVLVSYTISFVIIGWMFVSSYKKYQKAQREVAKKKEKANPAG